MPQTSCVLLNFCGHDICIILLNPCLSHSGIHWMLSLKGSEGQRGLEISELAKVNTCRTQMWLIRSTCDSGRKQPGGLMRKDWSSGPLPERLRLPGIRTGLLLRVSPTKDKPLPLGAT